MGLRHVVIPMLLAIGVSFAANPARAEPSPEPSEEQLAAARSSFAEGLRLEEYRDFVGALERFEAVAAIKLTPQVRFHRALCLEKLGRWVEAREDFARARDEALAGTDELARVRTNSQTHVAWLDARLPTLTLSLAPPGARAMVDARVLPVSLGAQPIALDPGPHVLRATAPGHAELVERFEIKPGQKLRGRVVLSRLGASAGQRPEPGRAPLYVGAGIAAVSWAGAGVALVLRNSTLSDLDAQCGADRQRCPETARGLDGRGATLNTLGNVFIGVGIAAAVFAIGAVLWNRSSSTDGAPVSPPSSLRLARN